MAKVKKNALGNKLGSALKKHATDETDYGLEFTNIPPGITGGIAKLSEAKLGVYQKGDSTGEQFLYLGGTVVSPKSHTYSPRVFADGKIVSLPVITVKTEGCLTRLMVPLCDTKRTPTKANPATVTTQEEHVAAALNELRKLGADTSEVSSQEDLEALLEALKDEAPYFKFSTSGSDPSAQYPQPRVWENWYGSKELADYAPEEDGSEVEEDEEEEESYEEEEPEEEVSEDETEEAEETEEESEEESEEEAEEEEEVDYAVLARAADKWERAKRKGPGGAEAQRLEELAQGCGLDSNKYDSWKALAEALEGGNGEPIEDDEEEEEAEEPSKGDVFMFKPKGAKKSIEVEVLTVNKKAETCTIKRLDDGKQYKEIPWDRLSE